MGEDQAHCDTDDIAKERRRELSEMKRRGEEMEKGCSEIRLAIEELALVKVEEKKASTLALLGVSNLLINVLDKIGPTMLVLRQDIQRNIERIEVLYASDPLAYSSLIEILKKENGEGTTRMADSCSRAIVWLTRSIDFSVALLERLEKDPESSFTQVVEESYNSTLKPWHGWISSAAYKVALKLIPEREIFINLLMGQAHDYDVLTGDIHELKSVLQPLLDEIHAVLRINRLDRMKCT